MFSVDSIKNYLKSKLAPPMNADVEVEDQESFFTWVKLFIALNSIVLGIGVFLVMDKREAWLIAICMVTAYFVLRKQNKSGSIHVGTNILLVVGMVALDFSLYLHRDLPSMTVLIWSVSFPLAAGIMTTPKQTMAWTAIAATNMGILISLLPHGWDNPKYVLNQFALIFFVGTMTYIFKSKHQTLMKLRDEDRIRYRSLLRVVCHDIASPVTVIDTAFQAMEIAAKAENRNLFEKSQATAVKFLAVVKDILHDVRHLEAAKSGKISIKQDPVNFAKIFVNLEEVYQHRLDKKGIEIKYIGGLNKFPEITGDFGKIQNQVLANLLSNAIKFSHESSSIEVSVADKGNSIIVSISDSGIGIPDNLLINLFDPVEQTSRPGTQGERGTGFGMPIVKSFVEAMGAQIAVHSTVDEGTRFDVTFTKNDLAS